MKWSHADTFGRIVYKLRAHVRSHRLSTSLIGAVVVGGSVFGAGLYTLEASRDAAAIGVDSRAVQWKNYRTPINFFEEIDGIQSVVDDAVVEADEQAAETSVSGNVQVNDVSIPIPSEGEVHRNIQSDNGTTTVDMSVNASSTTSDISSQKTTLNINVESQSESYYGQDGP